MDFTKTGDRRLSWAVFIAFLFVSVGLLLFQHSNSRSQPQVPQHQGSLDGQSVSAVGAVGSVIGTRALTLAGTGDLGDNLLVVSDKPFVPVGGGNGQMLVHQRDTVYIQGEVHKFNRQAVERQLGVRLSPQQFAKYEGKPFIFAHMVKSQ